MPSRASSEPKLRISELAGPADHDLPRRILATVRLNRSSRQTCQNPEILDVNQLADFLGVTANTIHNLTRARTISRGDTPLPHLKVSRALKFRKESVLRWLEQKEAATAVRQ